MKRKKGNDENLENPSASKKKIKGEKNILPGAVAIGILAAAIIFAIMINTEKNILQDFEKKEIYTAAKQVPKGLTITAENYAEYFTVKELDASVIPETAILNPEQLEGCIPKTAIEPGTLITQGMFEDVNEITADMEEPVIAGFKADDLYQVVGGVLRAGDRIHIYSVSEDGETILCWENVYVQGVFDQSGTVIASGDTASASQRINVYMDKKDVEAFYSNLAQGTLRAVKVCQ